MSGDHLCRRHANVELVNTVDGVLAQAGLDRGDVGCYVVGRGPGSFTGVRIGISTAKGLARGATVPLLGFGHLLAKGVRTALAEEGAVGILTGGLTAAAAGITTSLVCGVVCSWVGKSHDQN